MQNKYLIFKEIGLIFIGIIFVCTVKVWAGTLISISSATYNGGSIDYVYGISIDGNNNIIVTGEWWWRNKG